MKRLIEKRLLIIFTLLIILGGTIAFLKFKEQDKSDFRLAIINEKEIELISMSPERKMINVLKISEEVPIWIPGGLGWYKSSSIKKLLDHEKKWGEVPNMLFYNFGYLPEKVLYISNSDEWRKGLLLKNMGFSRWLKYKINNSQMIVKEEIVKKGLEDEKVLLDEIMTRDFADSRLVNEDLRISVVNTTSESGLASFIGRNLEWAGFSVISTESLNEKVGNCAMMIGTKVKESFGFLLLEKLFKCDIKDNNDLDDFDVEIYFGQEYAQMLKYSNYNN